MNEEKIIKEGILDDSDLFEDLGKISKEENEKSLNDFLDIYEEYLKEMDDEELNEDYRQYLKENGIKRDFK